MNKTALRVVVAAVAIILVFSLVAPLVGWRGYGWGMMMWPGMTSLWRFPFLGGVMMIVLWVLIVGGVIWLVLSLAQGGFRQETGSSGKETPLEILKRRYAAGEITQEQFEAIKRDLIA